MTQDQLGKLLQLIDRKKRLVELNYVVSQDVILNLSASKCSNNDILDSNSIMKVNIKHEPELLEIIKNWTSVEIERLNKQIDLI